jgi:glycosyltransferase involved in cell wall biosynthesis
VGPLDIDIPLPTRAFRYLSKRILKKGYRSYMDPFSGRRLGKVVADALQNTDCDVLLTNDYGIAAYTPTESPVVLCTDAMFPRDYGNHVNPRLDDLSLLSVKFCQLVTKKGLQAASLCVFPATFAGEEACVEYGVSSDNIKIIPFGANIEDPGGHIAARRSLDQAVKSTRITLLFVGKDWDGKGGDVAVETVEILRQKGIEAKLHVVGVPSLRRDVDNVRVHGLLDKSRPEDRQKLHALYAESDALIVPSIAEGFGITYVEAAAHGLPSMGYETIGVSTAVKDGISGILLPLGAPAAAFANVVLSWLTDPGSYDDLVEGARRYYEQVVNWTTAVEQLVSEVSSRFLQTDRNTAADQSTCTRGSEDRHHARNR